MSDTIFLNLTYRKILNKKDLQDKKTSSYLAKLGEPHSLIISVSKSEYEQIKNDDFSPLENAYYKYRNTNPSLAIVSYGQFDDVETITVDGEELSYSENPEYKKHYLTVDLVSVEDATHEDLYRQRLKNHDWTYAYSDDRRVYNAGSSSFSVIANMRSNLDKDGSIWNEYAPEGFKVKSK